MASFQQPFYGHSQTPAAFPLTPNPQADDFAPLPTYGNGFDGFTNFNFDGLSPHGHSSISSQVPRLPSPETSQSHRGGRSSSEEKESTLTPGQRVSDRGDDDELSILLTSVQRRKEQNRAAQRAFRERKERHVKELESRLASLEQANSRTSAENDKLKERLEKTLLENRLLTENHQRSHSPPEAPEMGPMGYKPMEPNKFTAINPTQQPPSSFTSPIFGEHPNNGPIHRITTSPKTGERLLGAGAAWDLIVNHTLYEQGLVDIGDISDRLKGLARCDGQGPVFEENVVLEAILASSGSGRDELLVDQPSPGLGYRRI